MRSLTGLDSKFSFSLTGCHTRVKEPSLPYNLHTSGCRNFGYIPFQRLLAMGNENANKLIFDTPTSWISFLDHKNIYIYIYIYCHPQTDCLVITQLFSVARHVGRLKLGSKPAQLYVRLCIRPLSQQAYHVS